MEMKRFMLLIAAAFSTWGATPGGADEVPATSPRTVPTDDGTTEERLRALEEQLRELQGAGGNLADATNVLNPRITVFGDFLGRFNPGGKLKDQDGHDRWSLRETEFDFQASIDPYARGVVILAIKDEDGTTETEVEEGYMESLGLPWSLTVRAGKFRQEAGPFNRLHLHDLPVTDRPLVHDRFYGEEGLAGTGLQVSGLIENPWDQYFEWTAAMINNDSATLFDTTDPERQAYLGHLKWFTELPADLQLELGGSFIHGLHENDPNHQDQELTGIDAMLLWRPEGAGLYRSAMLQGEVLRGDREILNGRDVRSNGWYVLGQVQLSRSWYLGAMRSASESPTNADDRETMSGATLSLYTSEFMRFRLGAERRNPDFGAEEWTVFNIGATFVFGAHPPHPYWANK